MAAGSKNFADEAKTHLREYVEYLGYDIRKVDRGGRRTWHTCPCCKSGVGNNGKFTPGFNVYEKADGTLAFYCFACHEHGSIFDLAAIVNNLDPHDWDAVKKPVAEFLNVDLSDASRSVRRSAPSSAGRRMTAPVQATEQDYERFRKEDRTYVVECMKHVHETDYFHERGLDDEVIKRFFLGYDPKKRAVVIPFVNPLTSSVDIYHCRNTRIESNAKGLGGWKHYFPPYRRKIIFNMAALGQPDDNTVFIVEAAFDALSIEQVGGSAIALSGNYSSHFEEIVDKYDLSGITFIVALDNDLKGKQLALKVGNLLEEAKVKFLYAEHESFKGGRYNDPNEVLMNDPDLLAEGVRYEMDRARCYEFAKEYDVAPTIEDEQASPSPVSEQVNEAVTVSQDRAEQDRIQKSASNLQRDAVGAR